MSKEQDTLKTIYNILLEYINEPKDKHTYSYWKCADVLDDVKEIVKDLELYKTAFEIMTDNKHTFFVCKGRGPASNEMVREAVLEQARKEIENGNKN